MTRTTSGELTELMALLNHLIYEASAINRYATFFFGVFYRSPAGSTTSTPATIRPCCSVNRQAAATSGFASSAAER